MAGEKDNKIVKLLLRKLQFYIFKGHHWEGIFDKVREVRHYRAKGFPLIHPMRSKPFQCRPYLKVVCVNLAATSTFRELSCE